MANITSTSNEKPLLSGDILTATNILENVLNATTDDKQPSQEEIEVYKTISDIALATLIAHFLSAFVLVANNLYHEYLLYTELRQ